MLEFIRRVFGNESGSSKTVAKDRLRLVLVHDRAGMSPAMLNRLREDLIKVISKYVEIDETALEFKLSQDDNEVAFVANIPVLNMKRDYATKG
ncbi:MAG TPA: cell division topological specificity factor MinE [Desulfosporosinus sp.]|nr:cell division topological specificity factor MinE [Desulfosporosinus sp.]